MALKNTYFTISEAAKELSVSRQTVYRWIADKNISTEKVGGVILIRKETIKKYITQKASESFAQMVYMFLKESIRKELGYTAADIIEETKSGKHEVAFLVTRKDGTREKVRVGGIEVTIDVKIGEDGEEIKGVILKNVIKEAYKPPEERTKKTK